MLYPTGYGSTLVTLEELDEIHGPKMHPEYRRRLFPWLASMGGDIGIGGGWRASGAQPDRPGFAPEGKSFHQSQTFASGVVGYCAVDLVRKDTGGGIHVGVAWVDSATAPDYGLHTFIVGEPWHLQPVEIRGWQSWVAAGRPDPDPTLELPGDTVDGEPFYFNTRPADPVAPLWVTYDGVRAYWVDPDRWAELGNPAGELVAGDQAERYRYWAPLDTDLARHL